MRRIQRIQAQANKQYHDAMLSIPYGRILKPQGTRAICQDVLGILDEINEKGINDNRYLEMSNHLMNLYREAPEDYEEDADSEFPEASDGFNHDFHRRILTYFGELQDRRISQNTFAYEIPHDSDIEIQPVNIPPVNTMPVNT
jgi:hypothetical protein